MTVNGKKAINMVSTNFLGVAGDPKIQASKANAQRELLSILGSPGLMPMHWCLRDMLC